MSKSGDEGFANSGNHPHSNMYKQPALDVAGGDALLERHFPCGKNISKDDGASEISIGTQPIPIPQAIRSASSNSDSHILTDHRGKIKPNVLGNSRKLPTIPEGDESFLELIPTPSPEETKSFNLKDKLNNCKTS